MHLQAGARGTSCPWGLDTASPDREGGDFNSNGSYNSANFGQLLAPIRCSG